MYCLPQEIEVWYTIPAIRKALASILTKKYGMTFEKAGKAIGVSKAAVSQYLKNKRAKAIVLPRSIKKEVDKSAEAISKNPKKALKEILRILKVMKNKRISCQVCKKYNKGVLEQCEMIPIPNVE